MVKLRMRELAHAVPLSQLAVHLHDTRGMGVANAWAGVIFLGARLRATFFADALAAGACRAEVVSFVVARFAGR